MTNPTDALRVAVNRNEIIRLEATVPWRGALLHCVLFRVTVSATKLIAEVHIFNTGLGQYRLLVIPRLPQPEKDTKFAVSLLI